MEPLCLHGTAVAVSGRGLLAIGPSGSGKSALALQLIALGAGLIADDRTILHRLDGTIRLECPAALRGLIEARGLGILHAPAHPPCPLALVVDLSRVEPDRLPPARTITLLDVPVPMVHNIDSHHFAAALWLYMTSGRSTP